MRDRLRELDRRESRGRRLHLVHDDAGRLGANWGQFVYFGGGRLANEVAPQLNPVTIRYHQYAACTAIPTNPGVVTVGPKAAYVVFMIESIDNSGNNTAFNFDQTKIFTQDSHDGLQDFVDPGLSVYPTSSDRSPSSPGRSRRGSTRSFRSTPISRWW